MQVESCKRLMRDAGAAHAVIIGLANDELGYILPAEDFNKPTDWQEPGEAYEESMSVGVEIGPKLTEMLEELLVGERGWFDGVICSTTFMS